VLMVFFSPKGLVLAADTDRFGLFFSSPSLFPRRRRTSSKHPLRTARTFFFFRPSGGAAQPTPRSSFLPPPFFFFSPLPWMISTANPTRSSSLSSQSAARRQGNPPPPFPLYLSDRDRANRPRLFPFFPSLSFPAQTSLFPRRRFVSLPVPRTITTPSLFPHAFTRWAFRTSGGNKRSPFFFPGSPPPLFLALE